MPRDIRITDDRGRDARIQYEGARRPPPRKTVTRDGAPVSHSYLIKVAEGRELHQLEAAHGGPEGLAQALLASDPEVDLEVVGRRIDRADRVFLKADGSVLYAGRVLQVVLNPDGSERERRDFLDVEATVDDTHALPWTGRMMPISDVVRRFALTRRVQLRHVDGLTFEFLRDLAEKLWTQKTMVVVGAGSKGQRPLIFQRNGSPYRGFLAGRLDGDRYVLSLHLSNLELKRPAAPSPEVKP
ncbi:MAG TPA: hypothetical protein PK095_13930 [Myxococcota bacterium]|nr:hypothetical protein [Myxococcota bacterium]